MNTHPQLAKTSMEISENKSYCHTETSSISSSPAAPSSKVAGSSTSSISTFTPRPIVRTRSLAFPGKVPLSSTVVTAHLFEPLEISVSENFSNYKLLLCNTHIPPKIILRLGLGFLFLVSSNTQYVHEEHTQL